MHEESDQIIIINIQKHDCAMPPCIYNHGYADMPAVEGCCKGGSS